MRVGACIAPTHSVNQKNKNVEYYFTKKGEKMRKEHETDLSFEEVKKTGLYESVEAFSGYEIITLTSEETNNCMGGGFILLKRERKSIKALC